MSCALCMSSSIFAEGTKAAATRYAVNEPISSSDCHRTMKRSREPCMDRHTLLVTRTGANEYALIHCIRSYSYKSRNNFLHAQPMAWAILFESIITILATVQHNWQCISWLYIDSTIEFHVKRYESISKQNGCIQVH